MKDVLINIASGLGIPRLIFEVVSSINDAAVQETINNFSLRNGMKYGVGILVLLGILSFQISSFLVLKYYRIKIENDRIELRLKNTDAVLNRIDTYSISKTLREKLKIKYLLHNF